MSGPRSEPPQSLYELLRARAEHNPNHVALRTRRAGGWVWTPWGELRDASRAVAADLAARGIRPGDRVALAAGGREEWVVADFGILAAGAVTVPIYPTATAEQVGWILRDSGARAVIVEGRAQLETLAVAVREAPELEWAVTFERAASSSLDAGTGRTIPLRWWPDVIRAGRDLDRDAGARLVDERASATRREDLATIVYTSGTTGRQRGVMLTHGNLLSEIEGVLAAVPVSEKDEHLLILPLAHIFARMVVFAQVACGARGAFAESTHRVLSNLAEVEPTFLASVPRLFEKMYAVANESATEEGPVKAGLWRWATSVGRRASQTKQRGKRLRGFDAVRHRYADRLVLERVRRTFGGRLRFAVSGGAALSRELAEWFHGCGVTVLEGYGLTESSGSSHVNRLGAFRFGTVGQPLAGVEARIGDDGEVLLRGPTIMRGYWNAPEETRAALDDDGWLHTGDVGRIDLDGYLSILDRKKDIIVTAGGSNVAPQPIEAQLERSPWVARAVVHGDGERYLVALLALDAAAIRRWAREHDRPEDLAVLARDADVIGLLQVDIDDVNRKLASYERIKRFAVLDHELSIEGGDLTETLKVRRRRVVEKHRALVRSLYEA